LSIGIILLGILPPDITIEEAKKERFKELWQSYKTKNSTDKCFQTFVGGVFVIL